MAIDRKTLQLADILITVKDNAVSHCGIVAGTRRQRRGADYEDVPYPDIIFHATGGGMKTDEISQWLATRGKTGIFRLKSMRNVTIGGKPARKQIADTAVKLSERCFYSKPRAYFLSWTGTCDFGSGAKGRLAKYTERLGNGQRNMIPVYCSEYVILSYQMAANGDESAPFFIELDGKHCLPKDLRNWILSRTNPGGSWEYLGDLS
jgi:hypothetical protein